MFAFMFKRPIRLFRPVKSAFSSRRRPGKQAHALAARSLDLGGHPGHRRGTGSLRHARLRARPPAQGGLALLPQARPATARYQRDDRPHPLHLVHGSFASPVPSQAAIDPLKKQTSEALLSSHFFSPVAKFVLIPFLSGSVAGAAQSLLSAPLDNARLLLLRRQRFLRLAHADSRNPRLRRTRLAGAGAGAGAGSALGGSPFVSWWGLIRDSVFQSARTAAGLGGPAAATEAASARERLEQGRRWARRGWSLFSLSLTKDTLGFGLFFVVFEVGREASRVAGLRWDGIDPDRVGIGEQEGETLKQRRTPSGLVLQAMGILISGGVAGWVFSLVARPFERMRGAVWEGRARWAERDGRLKVIEDFAPAGRDPHAQPAQPSSDTRAQKLQASATAPPLPSPRRARKTSAGNASERRANEVLGPRGRKGFRVRIGRIRTVARSAARVRRRRARKDARERRARLLDAAAAAAAEQGRPALAAAAAAEKHRSEKTTLGPPDSRQQLASGPTAQERLPMPTASALVRDACRRYGTTTFLFAPRSTLQELDARASKPSPSPLLKPLPPVRSHKVGPTRLSARGRQAAEVVKKQASGKGWRAGARVLSYSAFVSFFLCAPSTAR